MIQYLRRISVQPTTLDDDSQESKTEKAVRRITINNTQNSSKAKPDRIMRARTAARRTSTKWINANPPSPKLRFSRTVYRPTLMSSPGVHEPCRNILSGAGLETGLCRTRQKSGRGGAAKRPQLHDLRAPRGASSSYHRVRQQQRQYNDAYNQPTQCWDGGMVGL